METGIHTMVIGYVAFRIAILAGFGWIAYKTLKRFKPAFFTAERTHSSREQAGQVNSRARSRL